MLRVVYSLLIGETVVLLRAVLGILVRLIIAETHALLCVFFVFLLIVETDVLKYTRLNNKPIRDS